MLGRLRGIEAEAAEQVGPHEVVVGDPPRFHEVTQRGVEVGAAMLEAEDPGQVVDAARERVHLREGHAQVLSQGVDGPVDGVAEADHRHSDPFLDRLHQHAHGVGVVEEDGGGADLGHVGGDPEHDGNRAQAAEDTADVDRVPKPEARRDIEVDLSRPGTSNLDDVDDEVGPVERLPPVQAAADRGRGAEGAGGPVRHPLGRRQAVLVNVVENDLRFPQLGVGEEVAEQVARELDAARADEDDPWHP